MEEIPKIGDIQIDQHLDHNRLAWKIKEVGRILMFLTLTAALLGAFGQGWLSEKTQSNGSLTIHYEQIIRYQAPSEIFFTILKPEVEKGQTALWIGKEFLSKADLDRFSPHPAKTVIGPDGQTFYFDMESGGPAEIRLHYRAEAWGQTLLKVRAGASAQEFRQIWLP